MTTLYAGHSQRSPSEDASCLINGSNRCDWWTLTPDVQVDTIQKVIEVCEELRTIATGHAVWVLLVALDVQIIFTNTFHSPTYLLGMIVTCDFVFCCTIRLNSSHVQWSPNVDPRTRSPTSRMGLCYKTVFWDLICLLRPALLDISLPRFQRKPLTKPI